MPKQPVLALAALLAAGNHFVGAGARAATGHFPEPAIRYSRELSGYGDGLGLSPFWDYKTLETEHFRITFDAPLEKVARQAANHLEEAHSFLTAELQWNPPLKTQVLLIDNADLANGQASAFDRFGMVLWATPPDNWGSINQYDDWLRLVCIHEYTHFLNMDTTKGFWALLRPFYGATWLPNTLWPAWMLEGLAVWNETRFTTAGRGRSAFYERVLRAAVEDHTLGGPRHIPLDRINGDNPYYPGGETAYLFGYQLMNQIARQPVASGRPGGANLLGQMSFNSGYRIPYAHAGNLLNLTGKGWYDLWEDWVRETLTRMEADLARIRSKPLTPVTRLSEGAFDAFGAAASPDGRWLAWTQDSLDRRSGLYLKELSSGRIRRLADKREGVSIAFTPDSKSIVLSALRHRDLFYNFSDLAVFDLERDRLYWLTDKLRARDPDLSSDGMQAVFTLNENSTTGLAMSPLSREGDRYTLGPHKILFMPETLGRVSTPKFSPDGGRVVFSLKNAGTQGEDLMELDLFEGGESLKVLVRDGHYNRFPAFDADGALYYVSDKTGVDNIYRFKGAESRLVTNVTTGLWFPAFGPNGAAYASVYTTHGWDIAEIKTAAADAGTPVKAVTVSEPPAPAPDSLSVSSGKTAEATLSDYHLFPSLWPRQWGPYGFSEFGGVTFGATVSGADAVDRHRYFLGMEYNTLVALPNWSAEYTNRSTPALISVGASRRTSSSSTDGSAYWRDSDFAAEIAYPIRWTYSSLTPSIGFGGERSELFDTNASASAVRVDPYIPTFDLFLSYSDAESSRLAFTPEGGRTTRLGTRLYLDGDARTWKGFFKDVEYLRLTEHSVLVPSFKSQWSSRRGRGDARVIARGRQNQVVSPFFDDSFDELGIRGYPFASYTWRSIGVGALDYRFPIADIFRGAGTNPLYVNQLFGFVFAEATWFPGAEVTLPSAGVGIRLSTELFLRLPLVLSIEYQKGFNEDYGGASEVLFAIEPVNFRF